MWYQEIKNCYFMSSLNHQAKTC